jgi:hypothetical protein
MLFSDKIIQRKPHLNSNLDLNQEREREREREREKERERLKDVWFLPKFKET